MGILTSIGESFVSSIVCDYLKKYSGPHCVNLKTAIAQNVDVYQLWIDNAKREGVHTLNDARVWSQRFPKVQYMVTAPNVKRWLAERDLREIVRTVETTEGGEAWLKWQLERFRGGLWGK